MNKTSVSSGIWILLLASFLSKLTVGWVLSGSSEYWSKGYRFFYFIAQNLIQHGSFFFEGRHSVYANQKLYAVCMPFYPLLLAFIGKLTNFSVLAWIFFEAAISTATVWLVYKIASNIAAPKAAFFAAILYALHPYALVHDTQLQETVLYTFLSTLSIWFLLSAIQQKKSALFILTGFSFALATLSRASHVVHFGFVIIWMIFIFRRNLKKHFYLPIFSVLVFILVLSPWLIRNQKQLGSPILTSITGGALAVAHHKLTFQDYPYKGSIDDSTIRVLASFEEEQKIYPFEHSNELAEGRWYQDLAINYIRTHKLEFLKRGLIKAGVNFFGVPSPLKGTFANIIYFSFFWALTFLAFKSLSQTWGTYYFQIFLLLSASQAFVSFLFWAHTSHRAFLDPLLAVLAGIGLNLFVSNPRKIN